MTCIIAAKGGDGSVVLGGDSVGVSGGELVRRRDRKIFRLGRLGVGFTTSYRMGQLVRFSLKVPEIPARGPTLAWMVREFVPALRRCLKSGGWLSKENDREEAGSFIVVGGGHIFAVDADLQVGEYDDFMTVGCGAPWANGALHTTRGQPAMARVRAGLLAAEEFSAYVRRPFNILRIQ